MANIDVAEVLTNHGGAALGGAVQRYAWDQSPTMGFLATGIAWAGGIFMENQMDGMLATLGKGVGYSGAAIGGWLMAETAMERSPLGGNVMETAGSRYLPGANVGGSLRGGNSFRSPSASNRRTTRAGDQLLFVVN